MKPHSEMGGVVGGVIGSVPGGELQSLSSVMESDSIWCIEFIDRTGAPMRPLLLEDRRDPRACSSEGPSSCMGATDWRKGTSNESFISS